MSKLDFLLSSQNFRQRILSALILVPLALAGIYAGGWVFWTLTVLISSLGLREWVRLVDPDANPFVRLAAQFFLLATLVVGQMLSVALAAMLGMVLALVLFLLAARHHPERAAWVVLGLPYILGFGLSLLSLRHDAPQGMGMVYFLVAVVWGTDIGAYLAGRLIGGPKLAPAISPNKTWAGLFGGIALAALMGYTVAHWFGVKEPHIAIGLAMLLAPVAQVGDLFESHIKRRSGVKESGGLIPGHGGILDRIDGLIFAAVFFVLFEIAVVNNQILWW